MHRHLGPGLLESAYQGCLAHEMTLRGIRFERERVLPVVYKGVHLDQGYRLDFLVEDLIVFELKSVAQLTDVHYAQVLSYLKLANLKLGLLLNLNVVRLKSGGIRRVANAL